MDPNATLEMLRRFIFKLSMGETVDVEDFAEYFEALDKWLTGGGFLPQQWEENRA